MISLLKNLLCRSSISPNDKGCQNIISDELEKIGFKCYALNKNDTSNLWAIFGNTKPIFCFCGHTDVVPQGNLSLWKYQPFKAIIKDNKIYGRGTADMKGAIAAQLFAVKDYIRINKKIKGSIAFLIISNPSFLKVYFIIQMASLNSK